MLVHAHTTAEPWVPMSRCSEDSRFMQLFVKDLRSKIKQNRGKKKNLSKRNKVVVSPYPSALREDSRLVDVNK